MKKTILYCGFGWSTNIGNAFIDYGIKYILKTAFNEFEIKYASNTSSFIEYKYTNGKGYKYLPFKKNRYFDIRTHIDAQYYVLCGALFNINWLKINSRFIDFLVKEQKRVFIIGGGGGNNYGKKEVDYVKNILDKMNLELFVSRDEQTYSNYKQYAKYTYNGIDCAFFLNDTFEPAKTNLGEYIVSTFDHRKEPKEISNYNNVFRLYHSAWDVARLELLFRKPRTILTLPFKNDLISDFPDDYLNLYANCDTTYTDRVHACVATLIFGNKAQYYPDSPRSLLFERVGMESIKKEVGVLDMDLIKNEKKGEIDFLINFKNSMINR